MENFELENSKLLEAKSNVPSDSEQETPKEKKKEKVEITKEQLEKKKEKQLRSHKIIPVKKQLSQSVEHRFTAGDLGNEIFCCKFSYDDKYVACGIFLLDLLILSLATKNGEIQVYATSSGKLAYTMNSTKPNIPFSYVRWRPGESLNKTKNVVLTVNSEGEIQHFHLNSGKLINVIQEKEMSNPQLLCADYNFDGSKFVVSGSDPIVFISSQFTLKNKIKLYDEEKRVKLMDLSGEGATIPGHSSRVFCVKFDNHNPNYLLSGGWDKSIIIWDIKTGKPVNSFYGPLICGDGIDTSERYILTASFTNSNQLQLWDFQYYKAQLTYSLETLNSEPVQLYSGCFGKGVLEGDFILAGGGSAENQNNIPGQSQNGAKVFEYGEGNEIELLFSIEDVSRQIDCVDFAQNGQMIAMAGGDGLLRVFNCTLDA